MTASSLPGHTLVHIWLTTIYITAFKCITLYLCYAYICYYKHMKILWIEYIISDKLILALCHLKDCVIQFQIIYNDVSIIAQ